MGSGGERYIRPDIRRASRSSPRLECRECGVICERVVSPWRCLGKRVGCVYAYRDGDSTYFGCLHKVFWPELDMSAFSVAGSVTGARDPYGALRVVRSPRPQCPVTIERAYVAMETHASCVNPGFGGREVVGVTDENEGEANTSLAGLLDPPDSPADNGT